MAYVIAAKADNETEYKFYRIDEWSNEWTKSLRDATEFSTLKKAQERLQQSDFIKPREMSDGTVYPPSMVHSGANINNARPQGSMTVRILRPEVIFHHDDGVVHSYQGNIDRTSKEQKLNRIKSILAEGGITEADLDLLRENRKR